jgi:hypothetical protein
MPLTVRRLPLEDATKISVWALVTDATPCARPGVETMRVKGARRAEEVAADGKTDRRRAAQGELVVFRRARECPMCVHGSCDAPCKAIGAEIKWVCQRYGHVIGWRVGVMSKYLERRVVRKACVLNEIFDD